MESHGYKEIDHIADLALMVWAEDFYSLLKQSAKGMYDLMDVELNHNCGAQNTFRIFAGTSETLLVDFLSEVLYLIEDKGQAFETFSFCKEEGELVINADGYEVRSIGRQIKAVTFHDLEIKETHTGVTVTITFDV